MPEPESEQASKTGSSVVFSVRVWQEDLGAGQWEWRGKVQHLASGEAAYFRDWKTLVTFLEAKSVHGHER